MVNLEKFLVAIIETSRVKNQLNARPKPLLHSVWLWAISLLHNLIFVEQTPHKKKECKFHIYEIYYNLDVLPEITSANYKNNKRTRPYATACIPKYCVHLIVDLDKTFALKAKRND